MNKRGFLVKNNVRFYGREQQTIDYILNWGYDIELIQPSNTEHNKNPDIILLDKIWEIKTPITNNKDTLERKIKSGGKQAENLIIDLRFAKISDILGRDILIKRFRKSRRVKSLIIISRSYGLESIKKK